MEDKKITDVLKKKAFGYSVKETVDEYDIEGVLIKRKVTKKHVPPDINALKVLKELESDSSYENMSDEDLQKLKRELLLKLKDIEQNNTKVVNQKSPKTK